MSGQQRLRPLLSLAVGGLLASLVLLGTVALIKGFVERANEAALLRERLLTAERQQQRGRSSASLQRDLDHLEAQLSGGGESGGSLAASAEQGAAHTQARLRELASPPVELASIRVLAPVADGSLTAVRTAAALRLPAEQALAFVSKLESATPPILVDNLRAVVRSNGMVSRGGVISPAEKAPLVELTINVRVYAPGSIAPGRSAAR